MRFYESLDGTRGRLQQGDLLCGVPFVYFMLDNALVVLQDRSRAVRNLVGSDGDIEGVVTKLERGWGLVLSQTCDLQPDAVTEAARKPIVIARVKPIRELSPQFHERPLKRAVSGVRNLANPGKAPTLFYLPPFTAGRIDVPRSGADLLDVQSFRPEDLSDLARLAVLRLSVSALQALQERCAYCFGRFAAPDRLYFTDEEWQWKQQQQA